MVGGGRIAHYLTAILEGMNMHVKLVERNMDRCRHISEVLPRTMVICGDGTDQELLESEMAASDAFIALTDRDEGQPHHLPLRHADGHRQGHRQEQPAELRRHRPARWAGQRHLPKLITANQILQVVRGMENSKGSVMTALYKSPAATPRPWSSW